MCFEKLFSQMKILKLSKRRLEAGVASVTGVTTVAGVTLVTGVTSFTMCAIEVHVLSLFGL